MRDLLSLLETLGSSAAGPFWLPVLIWTGLASAVVVGLRVVGARAHPLTHARLLSATSAALPLGVLAARLAPPTPIQLVVSVPLSPVLIVADSVAPALAAPEASFSWLLVGLGAATVMLAAGAAVGLAGLLVSTTRLVLVARRVRPAAPAVRALCNRVRREVGVRKAVRIGVIDEDTRAPFVYGLLRPTIVLPSGLGADAETLRMVLLHELAHVRHGDLTSRLWSAVLRACFLAHPLVGLLGRDLDAARERACDAAVLGAPDVSARRYGSLLLTVAYSPAPRLALGMASASPLHQRLLAMNAPPRRNPLAPTLALLLGVGLATLPAVAQVASPPPAPPPPAEAPAPPPAGDRPEIIGGIQGVFERVEYPEMAKRAGIEGSVLVTFLVQPDGSVSDISVARTDLNASPDGDDGGLVAEALRVTRTLRFRPADGQKAPFEFALPYFFKLPASEASAEEKAAADRIRPHVRFAGVDPEQLVPDSKRAFSGWYSYFPTYIHEEGIEPFETEVRYVFTDDGRVGSIEFAGGDERHADIVRGLAGTMELLPDARPAAGSTRSGTLKVSYAPGG